MRFVNLTAPSLAFLLVIVFTFDVGLLHQEDGTLVPIPLTECTMYHRGRGGNENEIAKRTSLYPTLLATPQLLFIRSVAAMQPPTTHTLRPVLRAPTPTRTNDTGSHLSAQPHPRLSSPRRSLGRCSVRRASTRLTHDRCPVQRVPPNQAGQRRRAALLHDRRPVRRVLLHQAGPRRRAAVRRYLRERQDRTPSAAVSRRADASRHARLVAHCATHRPHRQSRRRRQPPSPARPPPRRPSRRASSSPSSSCLLWVTKATRTSLICANSRHSPLPQPVCRCSPGERSPSRRHRGRRRDGGRKVQGNANALSLPTNRGQQEKRNRDQDPACRGTDVGQRDLRQACATHR